MSLLKKLLKDKDITSLLRGLSAGFLVKISALGIGFGVQIVLARTLGVEEYGIYVYVMTFVITLVKISMLGSDVGAVRFIPKYQVEEKFSAVKGFIFRSTQVILLLSVLAATGLVGYMFWDYGSSAHPIFLCFLFTLVLVPLRAVVNYMGAVLRAFGKVVIALGPITVFIPGILGLVVSIFYFLDQPLSARNALFIQVGACIVVLVVLLISVWRTVPGHIKSTVPTYENKVWLLTCIPFGLNLFFVFLNQQLGILLLGSMADMTQVGIYNAANKIVGLIVFGQSVINLILAPKMSELYTKGDMKQLQKNIHFVTRLNVAVSSPIVLLLIFFGDYVLFLYGEEFTEAFVPLIILCSSYFVAILTGTAGWLLNMTGNQNTTIKIMSAALILNVILNFSLIPSYGTIGAAISAAVTSIFWNSSFYLFVWLKLRIRASIF